MLIDPGISLPKRTASQPGRTEPIGRAHPANQISRRGERRGVENLASVGCGDPMMPLREVSSHHGA